MGVDSYLERFFLDNTHPLTVELDLHLRVLDIQGSPDYFGFDTPAVGQPLLNTMPFLEGILEGLEETPSILPFVSTPAGKSTHIHLFKSGSTLGVIFLDATEEHDRLQQQQQLANELQLLKKKQEKLLLQLKEANSAKSRFIANMSHEFRTPLTSVLGYGDLLREMNDLPDKASGYLQAIERNAQHLLVMIDNLLDQARIDADELHISATQINLKPVFADLVSLIEPLALRKGLDFQLTVTDDLPASVLIDEMRLRQLLINLTGNAVKYTETGRIDVHAAWHDNDLTVTVKDTGPGIPEQLREKIFQPFQQNSGTSYQKGAGLGLAISREISRAMGGDLVLRYTSGEGSEFSFTLTAREMHPNTHPDQRLQANSILIAEDDPDIQALLAFHLESAGYSLRICGNGVDAIDAAMESQPDLILMDINMPKMGGDEAVKVLRQKGFDRPIIAMTAASSESVQHAAIASGFDEYLQKPIDAAHLKASVATLLSDS
ncbi:MAG: hypothetical protein C0631_00050 [Sedimenticola sp.]|nr:MAG: hypothetical protein C0631_00050 [Sedimenticola sp.]